VDRHLRPYAIVLTEKPPSRFTLPPDRGRDRIGVRVRGFFLQILAYRNRADKWVGAPFIIAQRLEPLPNPPRPVDRVSRVTVAALAAVGVIFILLTIWEQRSRRTVRRVRDADMPSDLNLPEE